MKNKVKTKTISPTLRFTIKLHTYGRQINGEVPKLALIDNAAPREMINNESKYRTYLLNFFKFMINDCFFMIKKLFQFIKSCFGKFPNRPI